MGWWFYHSCKGHFEMIVNTKDKVKFCKALVKNKGYCITNSCSNCLINDEIHELTDMCITSDALKVAQAFLRSIQDEDNQI
jgi:hypothetical protein